MKIISGSLLLGLLCAACTQNPTPSNTPRDAQPKLSGGRIATPTTDTTLLLGASLRITLQTDPAQTFDSVTLQIEKTQLNPTNDTLYDTNHLGTGIHWMQATFWKNNNSLTDRRKLRILAPKPPKNYTYITEKEFPHDPKAYTQGLLFHDGYLYESTGQRGESSLRKVDLHSGDVLKKIDLAPEYFGEGLEYLNGKLYQLTWTKGTGFVYDAESFASLRTFHYNTQGWGLTTDGASFYLTDGSENIYILDTANFRIVRTLQAYTERAPLKNLNELEWVDGKLYANIYTTDQIAIINPQNGVVEGLIHLTGLLRPSATNAQADVLNGIAYDPATQRLFLTGKYWDYLYQVRLREK